MICKGSLALPLPNELLVFLLIAFGGFPVVILAGPATLHRMFGLEHSTCSSSMCCRWHLLCCFFCLCDLLTWVFPPSSYTQCATAGSIRRN